MYWYLLRLHARIHTDINDLLHSSTSGSTKCETIPQESTRGIACTEPRSLPQVHRYTQSYVICTMLLLLLKYNYDLTFINTLTLHKTPSNSLTADLMSLPTAYSFFRFLASRPPWRSRATSCDLSSWCSFFNSPIIYRGSTLLQSVVLVHGCKLPHSYFFIRLLFVVVGLGFIPI